MNVKTCPECRTKHNGLLCPKGCDVVGRGQPTEVFRRLSQTTPTRLFRVVIQWAHIVKTAEVLVRALTPAGAIKVARDDGRRTVAAAYTVYELSEPTGSGLVTQQPQIPTEFCTGPKLSYMAGAKKE